MTSLISQIYHRVSHYIWLSQILAFTIFGLVSFLSPLPILDVLIVCEGAWIITWTIIAMTVAAAIRKANNDITKSRE